jgi:cyanophycin synthetase
VRLEDLRHLCGPNVFTDRPACCARIELEELTGRETTDYPGFAGRLTAALPGLAEHHCAAGRPGGFIEAMARGTYFGHVTEHVALELSGLAGRDVHLGRTIWAGADGRYDIMMECPRDEPAQSAVPRDLLATAMAAVGEVLAGRTPDLAGDVTRICAVVERERLGVSTAALADAARRRGIPVRRIGDRSMLRLGYGRHRRLVCAALTGQTSVIGVDIAADKMLAKQLLADAGVPVPEGIVAWSAQEAAAAVATLGGPVVIKPREGRQGVNVSVGVATDEEAVAAFDRATAGHGGVVVERFVPGTDYRVLVVDGRVVAAAQLHPAAVTGDGRGDIGELVAQLNRDPRRGDGHSRPLTKIRLDDHALAHLAAQGLDARSVPADGQVVTLRRNANLSTGGTSRDVTDLVHDEVAALCCRAAAVVGLDVCGVDLRLADIGQGFGASPGGRPPQTPPSSAGPGGRPPQTPPNDQGAVIEVNASPGLRMHLSPAAGRPRDVAGAIVDTLYPPGAPSRVPVVAVTGTNGKTTTVRMIGHILRQAGLRVGMATTDGVHSGDRLVYAADASGPRSAEMVLDDTGVEAAVLETARGGIIRGGLGYDRADVAVITNISADHLGADGVEDLEELVGVKALIAEEVQDGGTVVLNADDPVVAAIAGRPRVRRNNPVIRYFSLSGDNPLAERHRQAGGITCELRDGRLVEFEAGRARTLLSVADLPGAFSGRAGHLVANALAAAAACRALGVSAKDIRRALATFTPGEFNPGRGNLYQTDRGPVIVDYGHNAAALHATGRMISEVWGGEAVAAITLPGDRRDDLVAAAAEAIAAWFGRVVVYEDADKRGRAPGEMTDLITAAVRRVRPQIGCIAANGPRPALQTAVAMAAGHPVLFVYEKLAMAADALDAVGARPWPAGADAPRRAWLADPVRSLCGVIGLVTLLHAMHQLEARSGTRVRGSGSWGAGPDVTQRPGWRAGGPAGRADRRAPAAGRVNPAAAGRPGGGQRRSGAGPRARADGPATRRHSRRAGASPRAGPVLGERRRGHPARPRAGSGARPRRPGQRARRPAGRAGVAGLVARWRGGRPRVRPSAGGAGPAGHVPGHRAAPGDDHRCGLGAPAARQRGADGADVRQPTAPLAGRRPAGLRRHQLPAGGHRGSARRARVRAAG